MRLESVADDLTMSPDTIKRFRLLPSVILDIVLSVEQPLEGGFESCLLGSCEVLGASGHILNIVDLISYWLRVVACEAISAQETITGRVLVGELAHDNI